MFSSGFCGSAAANGPSSSSRQSVSPSFRGLSWIRSPSSVPSIGASASPRASKPTEKLPIEPEWVPDDTVKRGCWRYPSIGPVWPDGPDAVFIETECGSFRWDGQSLEAGKPDAEDLARRDAIHGGGDARLVRLGRRLALRR